MAEPQEFSRLEEAFCGGDGGGGARVARVERIREARDSANRATFLGRDRREV